MFNFYWYGWSNRKRYILCFTKIANRVQAPCKACITVFLVWSAIIPQTADDTNKTDKTIKKRELRVVNDNSFI